MNSRFKSMDSYEKLGVDLTPISFSSPVEYAFHLWQQFLSNSSKPQRLLKGQFLTPPEVARYMASMVNITASSLDVLDPGAGTGILAAAVAENVTINSKVKQIHFDLYETDVNLCELLRKLTSFTKDWLADHAIDSSFSILNSDFIVDHEHTFNSIRKLDNSRESAYDTVIMNPPYFKLRKSDIKSRAAQNIVHGQPNIYFIFLMLGALLLKKRGQLISITPRSFTSGAYFQKFRKEFFSMMHPVNVHLFNSRTDTFKESKVLQETMILSAIKNIQHERTTITSSLGVEDLDKSTIIEVETSDILRTYDGQVLFLPTTFEELQIMNELESLPQTLHSLGFRVSTGPVVPFRATEFLVDTQPSENYVPLVWMHNVQPMEIKWPLSISKSQYIKNSSKSKKLLLPNAPYVLLHRFSAKEQKKRIVAAPYNPECCDFTHIGIENHINYIHRPHDSLTWFECLGLAAILNTNILDNYIRIRSGSTQINASDMRFLPMPSLDLISSIGRDLANTDCTNIHRIEQVVLSQLDSSKLTASNAKH